MERVAGAWSRMRAAASSTFCSGALSRSSRRRRNGARPGAEPNGNRAEGYPGQFTRSGYGKNDSKSARRNGNGRPERFNKNAPRSRGKSRSR